jgi:hypothetical protein
VEAACDVCAGDDTKHGLVVTDSLTEVGIEIDSRYHELDDRGPILEP